MLIRTKKIKFDRQIVAIARVHGAEILYTDDESQTDFAKAIDMKVIHSWELEMSDKHAQGDMLEK